MPNHVKNVLTFNNLTRNEREFILYRFLKTDESSSAMNIFDFDAVIPEPKTESECPGDCKVNKDSHVQINPDKPWFDWYTWRNRYWGTKWGAYDGFTSFGHNSETEKETITCEFTTAWSPPIPVYEQLAKLYPQFEWDVLCSDECGESGKIVHLKNSKIIDMPELSAHEEKEIYYELWGVYDDEEGGE